MKKALHNPTGRIAELVLPPFGYLNTRQAEVLNDDRYIAAKFEPEKSQAHRIKLWETLASDVADSLAQQFGPMWGMAGWQSAWQSLSLADMSCMHTLRIDGHWGATVSTPSATSKRHEQAFTFEDDGNVTESLKYYCASDAFRQSDLDVVRSVGDAALASYLGSLHLKVKASFQRPRPNQSAFVLGHEQAQLRFASARSALTPSFISGHAIEYGLYFLVAHRELAKIGASNSLLAGCLQMVVDVGDRRVFGGLHFPSDNIASWIVLANILSQYSELTPLKCRLKTCVSSSNVYKVVVASKDKEYDAALEALHVALK